VALSGCGGVLIWEVGDAGGGDRSGAEEEAGLVGEERSGLLLLAARKAFKSEFFPKIIL
jgi:hypothetical protein